MDEKRGWRAMTNAKMGAIASPARVSCQPRMSAQMSPVESIMNTTKVCS